MQGLFGHLAFASPETHPPGRAGRVLYSENRGVLGRGEQGVGYVEVQAVVISPGSLSSRRTNTFLFAFADSRATSPTP